jgi:hypothetical protein
VLYRIIQIWPSGIEPRDSDSSSEEFSSGVNGRVSKCTGEILMTNSTPSGARLPITAEYLSENEPLELLLFHYVKSSCNRISAPGEGSHMRIPTPNEVESQTDQAHGNPLEKPCKIIGQKSDKAKCNSLKQELLNCEGKVLQNLYSAVRSRPAPPSSLPRSVCRECSLLEVKVCGTFASNGRDEQ